MRWLPEPFHLGWGALLVALVALAAFARRRPVRPGVALHLVLGAATLGWTGHTLAAIFGDHPAGLEVLAVRLERPVDGRALALGRADAADLRLPDPAMDGLHAWIRWDPEPALQGATARRRVELDGHEAQELPLPDGARLLGDRVEAEVRGPPWTLGGVPLRPGWRGWLRAALLPRSDVVLAELDAATLRPLPAGQVRSEPRGRLMLRDGALVLGFPGAADRAGFDVRVLVGGAEIRPSARWVPLATGQRLTAGRASFDVEVGADTVLLRTRGVPLRWDAAPQGHVFGDLSWQAGAWVALRGGLQPGMDGWRLADDGPTRVVARPGAVAWLPMAGGTVQVRAVAPGGLGQALRGQAGVADVRAVRSIAVAGLAWLLLCVALPRAGLLTARSAGVFHGAGLLVGAGVVALARLADPGEPARAAPLLRHTAILSVSLSLCALAAAVVAARAACGAVGRGLLDWLDAHGRWPVAAALAALVAQVPFGELGVAVPGLGSVQPIEAARSLLVLHAGFWIARAGEEASLRAGGLSGLRARGRAMAWAVPVLAVAALCSAVDDLSPILVFAAFLLAVYADSLLLPAWASRRRLDGLGVEAAVLALVAALGLGLVLSDPQSTVARRLAVWWDPWSGRGDAAQVLSALWASASGGLWGLGWTGANGVLPPAVQDDFLLALLAARGGVASLALVAATWAAVIVSGLSALDGPGRVQPTQRARNRADRLARAALWMLALQAAVVLGSATGGLPVMGQPMPLIAAAGSQLVLFVLPCLALVLAASRVRVPVRGQSFAVPALPDDGWTWHSVLPSSAGER